MSLCFVTAWNAYRGIERCWELGGSLLFLNTDKQIGWLNSWIALHVAVVNVLSTTALDTQLATVAVEFAFLQTSSRPSRTFRRECSML